MKTCSAIHVFLGLFLAGCEPRAMGAGEALAALDAYLLSGRGAAATTEPIGISTGFSIGDAAEDAAAQLAAFWQSQQPCAEVSWADSTVTVDYGGLDDDCTFDGRTYGGVASVALSDVTAKSVSVVHTWQELTNGDVLVNGEADVLWSDALGTRQVYTAHSWQDVETGEVVEVLDEHTWGLLDDSTSFWDGMTVEGFRDWRTSDGLWSLSTTDLEVRLQDPVPQSGTVQVVNPQSQRLFIVHERLDDTTIRVTLDSTQRQWVFDVNSLGEVTAVE